jgi:hypothetical protein
LGGCERFSTANIYGDSASADMDEAYGKIVQLALARKLKGRSMAGGGS